MKKKPVKKTASTKEQHHRPNKSGEDKSSPFKKSASGKSANPKQTVSKKQQPMEENRELKTSDIFTPQEVAHFKTLLLEKRAEIIGDMSAIENEALDKSRGESSGDLSNMPIHMADLGTDNYEQEFALNLVDSERRLLNEIHAALERIEDGVYGICEGTGKPISKTRLEACPWSRFSIEYAQMVEQGLVREGDKVYSSPDRYKSRDDDEENSEDVEDAQSSDEIDDAAAEDGELEEEPLDDEEIDDIDTDLDSIEDHHEKPIEEDESADEDDHRLRHKGGSEPFATYDLDENLDEEDSDDR